MAPFRRWAEQTPPLRLGRLAIAENRHVPGRVIKGEARQGRALPPLRKGRRRHPEPTTLDLAAPVDPARDHLRRQQTSPAPTPTGTGSPSGTPTPSMDSASHPKPQRNLARTRTQPMGLGHCFCNGVSLPDALLGSDKRAPRAGRIAGLRISKNSSFLRRTVRRSFRARRVQVLETSAVLGRRLAAFRLRRGRGGCFRDRMRS
jgi:hypothetical protein